MHNLLGRSRLHHVIPQRAALSCDKKELLPPQHPLIFPPKMSPQHAAIFPTYMRGKCAGDLLFLNILVTWIRAASAFHFRKTICINSYKTLKHCSKGQLSTLQISVKVSQNFVLFVIDIHMVCAGWYNQISEWCHAASSWSALASITFMFSHFLYSDRCYQESAGGLDFPFYSPSTHSYFCCCGSF